MRQWLGGSDHSAVFLTERAGENSQKAAIKLIPVNGWDTDAQLSRWADSAKLTHPHLIRLFEYGRCQIDDTPLLYVVMEYAEENLAEILPLRPLAADEAAQMLRPTTEALAYLHQAGFVHGQIKPANIMAAGDQLKISADALRKAGERSGARVVSVYDSVYDAPEMKIAGQSPAADIWSLGATLVAVLTQNEPRSDSGEAEAGEVLETIPQPFREIARQCLQVDPQRRCTVGEILRQIEPNAHQHQPREDHPAKAQPANAPQVEKQIPEKLPKRWMVVPIVAAALFLAALIGVKLMSHQPAVPAAETRPDTAPAEVSPAQAPAPFSEIKKPEQKGIVRGSVQQQVLPEVARSAQNTITGRLKVGVQVQVDAAGNVSQAKLISPGPSKYFANLALAAARRWKFTPPQVDGQAAPSAWILRFQFARGGNQVFPAEIKP
jgi:TonB family protein